MAVVTRTQVDANKIKKAPAITASGLKASVPRLAEPRLLDEGVSKELSSDQLLEAISRNLEGMSVTMLQVAKRFGKADGATETVVLAADASVRQRLLAEGRVYVGLESLRVREYEMTQRCYGCGSFGPLIRNCAIGEILCNHCGVVGHKAAGCQDPVRCRNCALRGLDASHKVNSPLCPILMRENERMKGIIVS